MSLIARLARLETMAARDAEVHGGQVFIVDPYDGRKTTEAYDHLATVHVILFHNHRDHLDLKVWGDPAYAIDWLADEVTRQGQIDRQRAHLGIAPFARAGD